MVLDGRMDEPAWEVADVADGFWQNFPFDTSAAELPTEVRMTFDEDALYVFAKLWQKRETYIIASLRRDFRSGLSDEFAINIDPFRDKINGFHFAVTPMNVQREGLINDGDAIPVDWDNKWYSAVQTHDEYWTVEMRIPFKTLRYKRSGNGDNIWRVSFTRYAAQQNERSCWIPVSRQFNANNLAFTGELRWATPPPKPGLNASLIPYLAASSSRDAEFELPRENQLTVGGDAKLAVTPALNLDLTFNPDFSQVEVDRQITNLSRFELFFPERRQFFLENEDLFSRFGFPSSRPFFSRRIGLASGTIQRTTTSGQEIEVDRTLNVPIIAGARLSGKLDNNWRVGLLNMQTAAVEELGLAPANYSVGVVQRRVFDRSVIGAIVTNKENFMPNGDGGYEHDADAYNRVVGLEYNLYSKDNKWIAELFYHRSISSGSDRDAQSSAMFVGRFTRNWRLFFPSQYIGSGYVAEMGFVPRTGFFSTSPGVTRTFFPKKPNVAKKIISYSLFFETNFVFNQPDYDLVDRSVSTGMSFEFPGQSSLSFNVASLYTFLFFSFDPTNTGGVELPEGTGYDYYAVSGGYESDLRKDFYYSVGISGGSYFNGEIVTLEGEINYRWQPYGTFAISAEYNDIQLPAPYSSSDFWLVGPRAELALSRSLFFSAFLQYNTQVDNVNINTRLQWRFRPVSDLFLVYTDNYFSNQFFTQPTGKNRALVLKATYWLNL